MINKLKYIGLGTAVAFALVALFAVVLVAKANPSLFIRKQTASATSTVVFMTPGNSTTTSPTFDLGVSGAQAADSAVLALALTGSSTPFTATVATTSYQVAFEYSQDSIDWYSDTLFTASTSNPIGITAPKSRNITLGTQTLAGVLISSTTPTKVLIDVPTPTRYVRAVISIPQGSTNGAAWAEFIAKRQAN